MRMAKGLGVGVFLVTVGVSLAGGLGAPKKEDMPKYLKQLLSSQVASERAKAAEMLGRRGSINSGDVEDAVEPLRKSLQKDIDAKVRTAAAYALGNIRLEADKTVPVLIDKLKTDTSADVKLATVVALGQYGPDAKEALQPIREYGKKFDPKKSKEGQAAITAVGQITMKPKKKG